MPDAPKSDGEFSDLFSRLPDPRPAAPTEGAVPGSRRAARQAAERAATGETQIAPVRDDADLLVSAGAPRGASPRPQRSSSAPPARERDGLDDLFVGASTVDGRARPPKSERRGRRLGGVIVLGLVVILVAGIAGAGLWVWTTYESQIRAVMGWEEPKDYADGEATGEALVTISSGDTGAVISQSLYDAGVTKMPDAFYDYLIESNENPTFVPGVFRLQQRMTSAAALAAILDPSNKQENSALLREGETVAQILPTLSENLGIPIEDFQAAVADPSAYGVPAATLEGWLFPALYEFDPGVTAQQVVQTMVDRTRQSLSAAGVPDGDAERVLTIASIIQREGRTADFAKVSRVIQNRLDQGMMLQMDSTAQYGYGELHAGSASTSEEAQFDDNPWNTYVIEGLPVGPISNAGDAAIAAAMNPEPGDWLYFVTVNLNTGETVFSTNIDDHEAAVAQWRAWCTENPDAGC